MQVDLGAGTRDRGDSFAHAFEIGGYAPRVEQTLVPGRSIDSSTGLPATSAIAR